MVCILSLHFSITAILETEIMLIDEVLSVGDQKFKKKSYNKMKELISKRDRTVVIVSHSMSTLEDLCDQIIWMHDGEIVMYDKPEIVIAGLYGFYEIMYIRCEMTPHLQVASNKSVTGEFVMV